MINKVIPCVCLLLTFGHHLHATDRIYPNTSATSPNGQYVVTATSPDNVVGEGQKRPYVSFQDNFTYTCVDSKTGMVLWTRAQVMETAAEAGDDEPFPKEGSPSSLFVSDMGETVIYTGWNELVIIDKAGHDVAKRRVIGDLINAAEVKQYVQQTTAGPMWAGRSHWFFLNQDAQRYFVILPWWGRYLMVNMGDGRVVLPDAKLTSAAEAATKAHVLSVLKAQQDGTAKKCACCGGSHEAVRASYWVGLMKLREAIPYLRRMESSPHSGSSTMGGLLDDIPQGEINPYSYSTFTTRQQAHLALRRLGERPGAYPVTQFRLEHEVYEKRAVYEPTPAKGPREGRVDQVQLGMRPKQVIDLLGAPDYVDASWEYDMDTANPYTLTITWGEGRRVSAIKQIRPARWQDGHSRNQP